MSLAAEIPARTPAKRAVLYRMAIGASLCPHGLKARDLLRRRGYAVEDHLLRSREQVEAFKAEHGIKSTPQTFIAGERVGGLDDLRRRLGVRVADPKALTYRPVLAVFAVTLLMALAVSLSTTGSPFTERAGEDFLAFSMCALAMLKLQDVERFSSQFLGYDLLARRWPPYAYLYPYAELVVGVLMVARILPWLSSPLALFIGALGAASVVKAVYVEGRELKCACVGGDSRVPLGALSLTENLTMVAMGVWMLTPWA